MRVKELFEARQASLWHGFKDGDHAFTALENNKMEGRTTHRWWPDRFRKDTEPGYDDSYWMKGISMTRVPRYASTWGEIIFELDQEKLLQNYKFLPVSWASTIGTTKPSNPRKESEEFLVTKKTKDTYKDTETGLMDVERLNDPDGVPVQPLNRFLKGIWVSDHYQNRIKKYKKDKDQDSSFIKNYIENYEKITNHPLFKGVLKSNRQIKETQHIFEGIHISKTIQPNTSGWLNIKTGEYIGYNPLSTAWYEHNEEEKSHTSIFVNNPEIFGYSSNKADELISRKDYEHDADPHVLKFASSLGWVRIIHKAYDNNETSIQGQNLREIAKAARIIQKQDNIEVLHYDVANTNTYGELHGRDIDMFAKTGRIPRKRISEDVKTGKIYNELYNTVIDKLRVFANETGKPGELRLTLDKILKEVTKKTTTEYFGMPKNFIVDTKVKMSKSYDSVTGRVKYIQDENVIVLTIFISRDFVNDSLKNVNSLAKLSHEIMSTIIHELTHVYQRYKAREKMDIRSGKTGKFVDDKGLVKDKDDPDFEERYLADRQEIEPHASEAVFELIRKNKGDPFEAYDHFKTMQPPFIGTMRRYWNNFGRVNQIPYQKVWRKFLKKMDQHFQQYLDEQK